MTSRDLFPESYESTQSDSLRTDLGIVNHWFVPKWLPENWFRNWTENSFTNVLHPSAIRWTLDENRVICDSCAFELQSEEKVLKSFSWEGFIHKNNDSYQTIHLKMLDLEMVHTYKKKKKKKVCVKMIHSKVIQVNMAGWAIVHMKRFTQKWFMRKWHQN